MRTARQYRCSGSSVAASSGARAHTRRSHDTSQGLDRLSLRGLPSSSARLDDDVCDCSERAAPAVLTPVEAARRLGVTRSRIYALVRQGELDDAGDDALRVTLASVERRLVTSP